MSNYLTVVVPTCNRPQFLPRALDSLYKQLTPVNVVVADDGDNPQETEDIVHACLPDATYVRTGSFNHSWPNWRAGAKAAISKYVSWLQDDDEVRPNYSTRIIEAFDRFPDANVWYGRLVVSIGDGMALWNCGNGPWVPVNMKSGEPWSWAQGSVLVSTAYFTSWSLAPAFAFRNGSAFQAALDRMPERCDIFVERLVPAMTANGGPFISDPIIAGFWNQHDDHLSTKQHKDQPRQTKLMVTELDRLLDEMPPDDKGNTWQNALASWAQLIPTQIVVGWIDQVDAVIKEGGPSRHAKTVQSILFGSLKGRVEIAFGAKRRWSRMVRRVANLLGA